MVKIGLLSDTHGYLHPSVFEHFKNCDEVWHAGDIGNYELATQLKNFKKLRAVYGNIDGAEIRTEFPEDLFLEIEGIKVFMTHIGGYPPKYNIRTRKIIATLQPTLFISGHSHILKIIYDKEIKCLHMNPGACGTHGWHKVKTLIRFDIDAGIIKNCEVIELK